MERTAAYLLLSLGILCEAGTAQGPAAGPVTLPSGYGQSFGNLNNNIPFSWTPTRYQQVFFGSELPASHRAIGLGLRFDESIGWTFGGQTVEIEIRLGYTTKTPATMTNVFASNLDVLSPGPVVVFPRGKFRLPDQTRPRLPNVSRFEMQIPFRVPFRWQKVAGRNLVLDVKLFGNDKQNFSFTYPLDYANGPAVTTSRLFSRLPTDPSGTLSRNSGLVICLLDRLQQRATYQYFGDGCTGTGGAVGITVPKFARVAWGSGSRGVGGQTAVNQQIIAGSEMGSTQLLFGHAFRTQIGHFDIDARTLELEVRIGHTKVAPTAMGANLAANRTSNLATVLSKRTFTYPAIDARNTDLDRFDNRIPWTVPFLWAANRNENLIIELRHWDKEVGSYPADSLRNRPEVSLVWARDPAAASGFAVPGSGFVFRFLTIGSGSAKPLLRRLGRPEIGKSFDIQLRDALAKQPALLMLGASKTNWGNLRLPFPLASIGGGACSLLVSPDAFFPALVDATGTTSLNFTIPNAPGLLGIDWHNQWMVLDSRANALGLAFSNGGTAHIGEM